MYHYLVKNKISGDRHLAEASSPSVAIADAAADAFTAERVDGEVLAMLKESLAVKRIGREPAPKASGATPEAEGKAKEKTPAPSATDPAE